jgi:uncharacterized protein YkwD
MIAVVVLSPACRVAEERRPAPEEPSATERKIFEAVNAQRQEHGLEALEWNSELLRPAREHSRRMGSAGFFSHEDPERGLLAKRLQAAGIRYMAAGENLFALKGIADVPQAAVQGWMNSPGHREIMLSRSFDGTAVGVYRTDTGVVYGTQIFTRKGLF